jgi:uncharacterized membrane protein
LRELAARGTESIWPAPVVVKDREPRATTHCSDAQRKRPSTDDTELPNRELAARGTESIWTAPVVAKDREPRAATHCSDA